MSMEETMLDWSFLPFDILPEIAIKLDTVEDFVYFSVTCKAWNYASSLVKSKWRSKFPWLLLAEKTINEDEDSIKTIRKLFSLSKNKRYDFELSPTFGARCWGSSCGWIVVFDINMQISLFNPFTQARILLPPQSTMPTQLGETDIAEDEDEDIDDLHNFLLHSFIRKAFVWKSITNYNDLIIIAIHGNNQMKLAFVRPGDQVWTPIITPDDKLVVDIAYYDGQMLIMYEDGALGCCNIRDACSLQPLKAMEYLREPDGILDKVLTRINSLYLVDSYGDLLMILRYKIDFIKGNKNDDRIYEKGEKGVGEELCYRTTTFEVFGLDFERKEWEQVEDIGDVALFVGDNCSMSIRASYSNNCKPNCIYFTDDEFQFWFPDVNVGRHDMGIFDIKNHKFETFYDGDDVRSCVCTPLWFTPTFDRHDVSSI